MPHISGDAPRPIFPAITTAPRVIEPESDRARTARLARARERREEDGREHERGPRRADDAVRPGRTVDVFA